MSNTKASFIKTRHESQSESDKRGSGIQPDASEAIEIVVGLDAIDEVIYALSARTASQVDTIITGNSISARRLNEAREASAAMYDRGIVSRSLYLDEFREHQDFLEYVRWLNERGSSVRTLPSLPKQMIIFDKTIAVLNSTLRNGSPSIVIHREKAAVDCFQALFELSWISASPLGNILNDDGTPILSGDRVLLDMLSMGNTYREIGAVLEINERTVARKVSELMARLEAKSLFALGVRAAKRNWL